MRASYLKNAPPTLITNYKQRLSKHRPVTTTSNGLSHFLVLERLICTEEMEQVWDFFGKYYTADWFYRSLFKTIINAMVLARRLPVSQKDLRNKYIEMASLAGQLKDLISENTATVSSYRAELHFVAEVLGDDWERLEQILERLRDEAKSKAKESLPIQRRSRRTAGESEEEVKLKTKARLFVGYLDYAILSLMNKLMPPRVAITIASSIYDPDKQYLDEDSLKQAIYDYRGKRKLI